MAHYAQVNSDGVVVQVLVMDNDMETNQGEAACIAWLQKNVNDDEWVKTSFNNKIRKQYAGIDYTYDSDKDIFISFKKLLYRSLVLKLIFLCNSFVNVEISFSADAILDFCLSSREL